MSTRTCLVVGKVQSCRSACSVSVSESQSCCRHVAAVTLPSHDLCQVLVLCTVVGGVFCGSLLYCPAKSGKSITGGFLFLLVGIVTLRWTYLEEMSAYNCVYSISGKLTTEVCNFFYFFFCNL